MTSRFVSFPSLFLFKKIFKTCERFRVPRPGSRALSAWGFDPPYPAGGRGVVLECCPPYCPQVLRQDDALDYAVADKEDVPVDVLGKFCLCCSRLDMVRQGGFRPVWALPVSEGR